MNTEGTILTHRGTYFDITDPANSPIDIDDIAHALGHICRYTGHTQSFYSVAEHSVLVSRVVRPDLALAGLLHDASEAYITDISRPLKMLLPDYRRIEAAVEEVVLGHFGLSVPLPPEVKVADHAVLLAEQRQVMFNQEGWSDDSEMADVTIGCLDPMSAKDQFLVRFYELVEQVPPMPTLGSA